MNDRCRLIQGDCLDVLRGLDAEIVHCAITSPPYWGLRRYLPEDHPDADACIGLEESPDSWVARLVEVFREVRRVLRPDGTLWLNIGFSYDGRGNVIDQPNMLKDALVRDGWYCKCPIVWSKPNCMPSSQDKRPTIAHEMVYLMARDKGTAYFYDADAVREGHKPESIIRMRSPLTTARDRFNGSAPGPSNVSDYLQRETGWGNPDGRNRRSVWTIPTEPYPEAHFATFPQALVKPCVLAGTSERGCCAACGAPWERVTERQDEYVYQDSGNRKRADAAGAVTSETSVFRTGCIRARATTDSQPTCSHNADVQPCLVLDPFCGSGTSGLVALQYGRRFVGIELSEQYIEMARRRLAGAAAQEVMQL